MKNRNIKQFFNKNFSKQLINDIALKTKFKTRIPKKINPIDFINLCCFSSLSIAQSTLEEMSSFFDFNHDISISPQGIDLRFNSSAVEFLKGIFLNLCKSQLNTSSKLFDNKGFKNIFLMDSSEIKLPINHKNKYKGSNKSNPAVLKVNLLIELLGYSFENLVVSEGRINEQNFSKYVYDKLSVDSLVMKDLGYYKHDDFLQIENRGAYFISRLKAGTRLYKLNPNPTLKKDGTIMKKSKYIETKASILGSELEVGEVLEEEFLIGKDKRPYRVIVKKLDEKSKNRKLDLVKERERRGGMNSKNAKNSIEISAYVTNYEGLEKEDIVELYRLRWQIELLFKIFKSDFKIDKLKNMKIERIEAHIYATLIKILLIIEISKRITGGFLKEQSIRRVIKSIKGILDNLLDKINDSIGLERMLEKIKRIISQKIKKSPA